MVAEVKAKAGKKVSEGKAAASDEVKAAMAAAADGGAKAALAVPKLQKEASKPAPAAAAAPRTDLPSHGNVFVGSIPADLTEQDLMDLFSKYGTIKGCKVLTDKLTGQPKGCAFVDFSTPEEAQAAIEGANADGTLVVKFADNAPGGAPGKGQGKDKNGKKGGKDSGKAAPEPSCNLYLKNVPKELSQGDLDGAFRDLGFTVTKSKLMQFSPMNTAMVMLSSQQEAASAIEKMNMTELPGIEGLMIVEYAVDKKAASIAWAASAGGGSPWGASAGGDWASAGQWGAAAPAVKSQGGPMQVKYAGTGEKSDNLFINGLPSPSVNIELLKQVFTALELTVVQCRAMPDTRGSGFSQAMVRLASPEEAETAIGMLNGEVFPDDIEMGPQECTLTVKYQGYGGEPSDNLYIAGLPSPQVTQESLSSVFVTLGWTVVRMKCVPDTRGQGTSSAMVQLASQEEAASAIEAMDGQVIEGLESEEAPEGKGKGKGKDKGKDKGDGQGQMSGTMGGMMGGAMGAMMAASGGSDIEAMILQIAAAKGWSAPDAGQGGGQAWGASAPSAGGKGKQNPAAAPDAGQGGGQAWGGGGQKGLVVKYAGNGQPSDNLYISGLPGTEMETAKLNELFTMLELSVVRSKVIADKLGYGACAAMVQLASQEQAQQAIDTFNGQVLNLADLYPEGVPAAQLPQGTKHAADWSSAPEAKRQATGDTKESAAVRMAQLIASRKDPSTSAADTAAAVAYLLDEKPAGLNAMQIAGLKAQQKALGGTGADAAVLNVRFAGKKGPDGSPVPSDYISISGFATSLPTESHMREVLKALNVTMKRMRAMKDQVMVQCGSVDEATKAIGDLHGWPLPDVEEPWPEA